MQDSFDVRGSAGPDPAPLLDFERLDVYRVALEFQALASGIRGPASFSGRGTVLGRGRLPAPGRHDRKRGGVVEPLVDPPGDGGRGGPLPGRTIVTITTSSGRSAGA